MIRITVTPHIRSLAVDDHVVKTTVFRGGEVNVKLDEKTVNALKTSSSDRYPSVHLVANIQSSDDLMALMLTVDAIRRIENRSEITVMIPYFPYARQDRLKAREPRATHDVCVTHVHEESSSKLCSCLRCGWPEDKIAAHPGVLCVPIELPRCVIEYRPNAESPANQFYCTTHDNVSPNANWCLTAAIDVITSPPKL
jgi:hypothetical protein